jgi:hypothetical protein
MRSSSHLLSRHLKPASTTMKELIMRETKGKGRPYIAFAIIPVLEDPFTSAKPMPELFTGAWQRAGHPTLFLNLHIAKKAAA